MYRINGRLDGVRFPIRRDAPVTCSDGGIGIHVCFRNICRKDWEFKSPLEHTHRWPNGMAPDCKSGPTGEIVRFNHDAHL